MHTRFGRSDKKQKQLKTIKEQGNDESAKSKEHRGSDVNTFDGPGAKEYSTVKHLVEDINNNDKSAPQKLAAHLRKRTSSWRDALRFLDRNKFKLGTIALALVVLYFLRENALEEGTIAFVTYQIFKHLDQKGVDWLLNVLKQNDFRLRFSPTELYKKATSVAEKLQQADPNLKGLVTRGLRERRDLTELEQYLLTLFGAVRNFANV